MARRMLDRLVRPLKQGVSPSQVALGLAVGAAIGLFPVLGTTTALGGAAAVALRLNHGVVQLANFALWPLQVPMIFAFVRVGELLTGASPMSLSVEALGSTLRTDPLALFGGFGAAGLHAVLGWLAAAPLAAALIFALARLAISAAQPTPRLAPVRAVAPNPEGRHGFRPSALLLLGLAFAPVPARAFDVVGDAFDDEGRFAYQERHRYTFVDGRKASAHTTYVDAAAQPIASMEAHYGEDPSAPVYLMRDLRFGWELTARRDGATIHMTRLVDGRRETKSVAVKPGRDVIIGPGFNDYIESRWSDLAAGKVLRCLFAVPDRLQVIPFRIERSGDPAEAGILRVRVKIDNGLLALIVPSLHLEYDGTAKRLLSYSGFSNVTDDRDKGRSVRIVFQRDQRVASIAPAGELGVGSWTGSRSGSIGAPE